MPKVGGPLERLNRIFNHLNRNSEIGPLISTGPFVFPPKSILFWGVCGELFFEPKGSFSHTFFLPSVPGFGFLFSWGLFNSWAHLLPISRFFLLREECFRALVSFSDPLEGPRVLSYPFREGL